MKLLLTKIFVGICLIPFYFLFTSQCLAPVNLVSKVTLSGKVTINAPAPPMATITDTFIRADADPMSNPASDGIGTWTPGMGTFNNCQILSASLRGTTGTENGARVLSPTFTANQSASLVVAGTEASILALGPMVRVQSTTDGSGYLAVADAATTLKIYKVTDTGTIGYTLLDPAITIAALADADVIKLSITGSTLEVFINNVSQGTRTDSTYTTGQPGVYMYGFGPVAGTFTATDL